MPIDEALEPLRTRICLRLKPKFENNQESLLSPSGRSAEPSCSLRDWPSSVAEVAVAFLEPGQSVGEELMRSHPPLREKGQVAEKGMCVISSQNKLSMLQ